MLCTVQTLRKLVYRQSYKENSRKRETLFSIFELIKGVKKVHALAKILWNMSFYLLTQHLMDISSVKLLFERCLYWSRFTLFERRLSAYRALRWRFSLIYTTCIKKAITFKHKSTKRHWIPLRSLRLLLRLADTANCRPDAKHFVTFCAKEIMFLPLCVWLSFSRISE